MELLQIIYKAIDERLGEDIVTIDLRSVNPFNDYMMITTARNSRMAMSIVDNIEAKVLENGFDVKGIEGNDESKWILIDCYTIVVHVFVQNERYVYDLEKLWLDQPRVKVSL